MSTYTIADFDNFIFDGIKYNLSPSIIEIIKNLERELAFHVDSSPPSNTYHPNSVKRTEKSSLNANGSNKNAGSYNANKKYPSNKSHTKSVKDEDWEIIRNFKSTKLEKKEGIEKLVNEIRVLFNKVSNKNYETQIPVIIESVKQFMETLDDPETTNTKDDDFLKLTKVIFDIIYTNKFFGELYAKLYNELIQITPQFMDVLKEQIEKIKSVQDLHYVDPNTDYDGYCNYTKSNDGKKSFIAFLIHMNKFQPGIFEYVVELLDYYVNMSIENADIENRMNEIEEITERIFLIITKSESALVEHNIWKTEILHKIITLSQMKMKEHKSISNRIIFRYMDIIDTMNH
jgi:hypothetical protein